MAVIKKGGGPKASSKVVDALRKLHGDDIGAVGGIHFPRSRLQSGIFPLDLASGGGIPRNKVSMLYGPFSCGKSLHMYRFIRQTQKEGRTAALIDVEDAHDDVWATKLGVNCKDLILIHPASAEQAVDAITELLHADDIGLVALDSVAAMITKNEIETDASVAAVGGTSQALGKMIRKAGDAFRIYTRRKEEGPVLLLLNQIRHKIGAGKGNPEYTPGGNALEFACSINIRFYGKDRFVEAVSKDLPSFRTTSGIIKKHKVPIVGKNFEYDICMLPQDGMQVGDVDAWNTVANYMKSYGVLEKAEKSGGGWTCLDESFKTLEQVHERYFKDQEFGEKARQLVFSKAILIGSQ